MEVTLPSAAVLKERLLENMQDYLIEKTQIHQKLGGQTMKLSALIVAYSEALKVLATKTDALTMKTLYINQPQILEVILEDNSEAIEELKKLTIIQH